MATLRANYGLGDAVEENELFSCIYLPDNCLFTGRIKSGKASIIRARDAYEIGFMANVNFKIESIDLRKIFTPFLISVMEFKSHSQILIDLSKAGKVRIGLSDLNLSNYQIALSLEAQFENWRELSELIGISMQTPEDGEAVQSLKQKMEEMRELYRREGNGGGIFTLEQFMKEHSPIQFEAL